MDLISFFIVCFNCVYVLFSKSHSAPHLVISGIEMFVLQRSRLCENHRGEKPELWREKPADSQAEMMGERPAGENPYRTAPHTTH